MEFYGRCLATPSVKLSTETYTPPNFPPKFKWHALKSQKGYYGEVLAAFELIEVTYNSNP